MTQQLDAKKLLYALGQARAKGRNDYPVASLWSALLMSFEQRVPSMEALRQQVPGLPPSSALSRFVTRLLENIPLIEEMQSEIICRRKWSGMLTFGEMILETSAKSAPVSATSRRSSVGADDGEKSLYDPKLSTHRLIKWHGYRLHYILDSKTALPLISCVTPASHSPHHTILSLLESLPPHLLKTCKYTLGDATYDDEALIHTLWNRFHIKPLFELTKATACSLSTPLPNRKNGLYNDRGEVYCTHPSTKEKHPMAFAGFERDRECLKYRCQASSYGVVCKGHARCSAKRGVRIPLSTNRRLFTPVARSSYKWHNLQTHLARKSTYEDYIKEALLPKLPFARGLDKLSLFCHLANLVLHTSNS